MISATSSSISLTASSIFSKLDTSNKGYIDSTTLQSALDSLSDSDTDVDVSELFNTLDSDSDGKVTEDEMSSGLESLVGQLNSQYDSMRMQGAMPPPPPPPADGEDEGYTQDELSSIASTTDDSKLSDLMSTLAENFEAADTNKDGKVNAEEAITYKDKQEESNNTSETSSSNLAEILKKLIAAYGESSTTLSTISESA